MEPKRQTLKQIFPVPELSDARVTLHVCPKCNKEIDTEIAEAMAEARSDYMHDLAEGA